MHDSRKPTPAFAALEASRAAMHASIARLDNYRLTRPRGGWETGITELLAGVCPWCGNPIQNIRVGPNACGPIGPRVVSWSCLDGCNP